MNSSQKKILVVDDDETLREILVDVFEDENYLVDVAANGTVALELMSENYYDLLLTDMFMPEMNGIELILKCQSQFPAIKIILLSGGGRDVTAEHGTRHVKFCDDEVDINVFLKKPCDLDEMLSVVKTILLE